MRVRRSNASDLTGLLTDRGSGRDGGGKKSDTAQRLINTEPAGESSPTPLLHGPLKTAAALSQGLGVRSAANGGRYFIKQKQTCSFFTDPSTKKQSTYRGLQI